MSNTTKDEQAENTNMSEETISVDNTTAQGEESNNSLPELSEIEALQTELEQVKKESQTNLDGWQRSRAEFTNYKRRTAQELLESRERGATDALAKILPAIDDFERALSTVPEGLKDDPWINGASLIFKNLQKILDEYKVDVIDPVGEEFNPNFHEAVGTDDSDEYESGTVTTTLQKGYRSGERVLRPALVRVAN